MNPFDLEGPRFLLFFVGLGTVVVLANWLVARAGVAHRSGGRPPASPYVSHYTRGGARETVLAAIVLLRARGLLDQMPGSGEPRRYRTRVGSSGLGQEPLEHALLEHFANGGDVGSACADAEVQRACAAFREKLEERASAAPASWFGGGSLFLAVSLAGLWYITAVRILGTGAPALRSALVLTPLAIGFSVASSIAARSRWRFPPRR